MFNFKPFVATGLAVIAISSAVNVSSSLATTPVKISYGSDTQISQEKISSGTFSGRSDHITTGDVSIVKTATGYELVFANNFELDGAPDSIVGFGNNGSFEIATKLGKLSKKTGAQTYQLPADFTPAQFSEVYVFCEKFSVPLGVATLN